jgi:hypothetical protein
VVVVGKDGWNDVRRMLELDQMRNPGLEQLLVPNVLGLDSWHVRAPDVFEEDALLRREIQSKVSSGTPAHDTQIVVQGLPNNVV